MRDDALKAPSAFANDGHVHEAWLTSMADGEEACVPAEATAHLDACDECTARLGALALLSIDAGAALHDVTAALANEPVSEPAPSPLRERATVRPGLVPRAFPTVAVLGGLAVALLAALPRLIFAAGHVGSFASALLGAVPFLAHALVLLARGWSHSSTLAFASLGSAVVLIFAGLSVARAMTRVEMVRGGV